MSNTVSGREPPFVGRSRELGVTRALREEASEGRSGVLLVSGPAGVGKTRFVREAAMLDAAAGSSVLWGTCYPELPLPYLPVASVLNSLGSRAARALHPGGVVASLLDAGASDQRRLELFLGITAELMNHVREQPTSVIIEDLHWADEASIELLGHLIPASVLEASMIGASLTWIVTVRPDPRPEPTQRLIDRVARHASLIELDGLAHAEAHRYVRQLCDARPTSEALDALLDSTAGNPLLLRGTLRRSLDDGALEIRDGELRLVGTGTLVGASDLDEQIRESIRRCRPETIDFLRVVALHGPVAPATLVDRLIAGDLDAAEADASAAGLIERDGDEIGFTHAQIRQVVHLDIPSTERASLHGRIADAVEADSGDAMTIAHHLRRAGSTIEPTRVARWALAAGDMAWDRAAWAKAARAYRTAIDHDADQLLDPGDLTEVLLRAGVAAYYADDDTARSLLERAAELARQRDDLPRWTQAAVLAARFTLVGTAASLGHREPIDDLRELAERLEHQPELAAVVHATITDLATVALDHDQAAEHAGLAGELLDDAADATVQTRVGLSLGVHHLARADLDQAWFHLERAERVGGDHERLAATARLGLLDLSRGLRARARSRLEACDEGAVDIAAQTSRQLPLAGLAALHASAGDLGAAVDSATLAMELYDLQRYAFTPGLAMPVAAMAHAMRGDERAAEEALSRWEQAGGRGIWRHRTLVRSELGEPIGPLRGDELQRWLRVREPTLFTLEQTCAAAQLAAVTATEPLAEAVITPLRSMHARGVRHALGWPWLLSRLIADCASILGRADEAATWYRTALEETEDGTGELERAGALVGSVRLGAPVHGSERSLDRAARILDDAGALRAGAEIRSMTEPPGPHRTRPRVRVVLVTDLVGSTELNVRAGDARYVELLEAHDRCIRRRLRSHDGVEFKHTGDGIAAWFESAADAVDAALGIVADLDRLSTTSPELPLAARIGLAAGEPVARGSDLFGIAVVAAARVCSRAGPGQVLASDEVEALAQGSGIRFRNHGEVELKGLPGRRIVHEVLPAALVDDRLGSR